MPLTITGSIVTPSTKLVVGNGSIAQPSFAFQSSPSTGLSNDNGTLKMSSNGSGTVAVSPNLVTVAGNLAADFLAGNGSALSSVNLANAYGNIDVDLNFGNFSMPANILYGTLDNGSLPLVISVSNIYANGAGLSGLNVANVTSGVLDNARLPADVSVSSVSANFAGDAFGLSNISASNIASGTLTNARLPSAITISSTITAANLAFASNTACNLYLATGNVVTCSTNLQTPGGLVAAINTTTAQTGVAFVHALGCTLHSASAAGVSTGLVTPTVGTFAAADGLSYYKLGPAIYDFWRTYVNLVAGTYTFRLHCGLNSDRGIVSVVLNSTTIGTLDLYGGLADSLQSITGIVVATSGVYKLELQVNSKNASSTNYYMIWRAASFLRTA